MDERQQRVASAVRSLAEEKLGKGAQAQVARATGYSDASISRFFSGKQPIPDEVMFAVAELIEMPWEQFRLAIGDDLPLPNTAGVMSRLVPIRVIDQEASASVRAGIPVEDVVYLTESDLRFAPSNYAGIRVRGDCMEPDINDGDLVAVELGAPFQSGDIVAAEVLRDGRAEVHVKRVRQRGLKWFLVDNQGESLEIQPENVAGLVIKVVRDLRRRRR